MTYGTLTTLGQDVFSKAWLRAPASTEIGRDTDAMFMWLWWFCVVWFVFLMGLMVYWVIKYRRRAGKIAPKSASHNTPLEIAWTIIPTLFLVYIFFRGFHGWIEKVVAPGDAVEMNLTGARWYWSLQYPNGAESPASTKIGAKDIPVFYMPAERSIKLKMQSADVMHAFWVPDFRIKQDLWPNRYSQMWFKAEKPDGSKTHPTISNDAKDEVAKALSGVPYSDHWLFCAEYCGDEHSEMAAIVRVVPEDAFNRWQDAIKNGTGTPAELGLAIWKQRCASCHTVDGGKNTGPTWKGIWGHQAQMAGGQMIMVDENYIRESILNPQAQIVMGFQGQNMPSFAGVLNDKQITSLVEYIKTLSDKGTLGDPAHPIGNDSGIGAPGTDVVKPGDLPGEVPEEKKPAPK